jgi:hypothetical protein
MAGRKITGPDQKPAGIPQKKPSAVPPLVGNQYFRVYFGSTLISFSRVSNVQRSSEHEDLAEGGLNDYLHVLTKPGQRPERDADL